MVVSGIDHCVQQEIVGYKETRTYSRANRFFKLGCPLAARAARCPIYRMARAIPLDCKLPIYKN
jgi:hypothetical protein